MNKYVCKLDVKELTIRMIEASTGAKRPEGVTTEEAYAFLNRGDKRALEIYSPLAIEAVKYFNERLETTKVYTSANDYLC